MAQIAIYIRVSGKAQEEKNQLPDCRRFAKDHGWKEYDIIEEKVSAFKNPDRDSLRKLEKYDHVVVWAYDRLQRNRVKFIQLMQYYSVKGVKIHSVKEKWLEEIHKIPPPWNEIMTDMLLQIVGWIAEEESQRKGERVRMAVKKKKGTTVSYRGKKWGRKNKRVNVERFKVSMGAGSLRKIAERYNEGLPDKHRISHTTVKKLLPIINKVKTKFLTVNKKEN